MRLTLAESPSGLVHLAQVLSNERLVTICGRDVNEETWTRLRSLDEQLDGKTPTTIRRMLELPACDKCLPDLRRVR